MTSIAFGGGPDISQRRAFAGLKDGTQVPGYGGYIPQLKYSIGKSYGDETFKLQQSYDHRHSLTNSFESVTKPSLRNLLPPSTGDNKYTEEMVPGYTGYIPRWPFKFGGTYKEDCDVCIDEHLTNLTRHSSKMSDLRGVARSTGRLRPVAGDPQVRDHLNTYRDTHPSGPVLLDDRRGSTEAPIPGYLGYVPRIRSTELGLGSRYHVATKSCLDTFQEEQDNYRKAQSAPISIHRTPGRTSGGNTAGAFSKRLYTEDGMIPKYTGYLPQRRFAFGKTYGDTTRSLDICSHGEPCFGDYTRTRPLHQSVVRC